MQAAKSFAIVLVCGLIIVAGGCVSADEHKELIVQNRLQQQRVAELESQVSALELQLTQAKQQLLTAQTRSSTEVDSLKEEIAALDKTLNDKRALITSLRERLIRGGGALPIELSVKLEDFAKKNEMVTYDAANEVLKFKSDLVFTPGSDKVAPKAAEAVKSLCKIVNSEEGKAFDIIIAGHTDDQPIKASRSRHRTNWHLSAHRAISVLDIMARNGVAPERLSVRGFGEYRPIVKNKPNKKGNPQNRRVEIYIVPHGT